MTSRKRTVSSLAAVAAVAILMGSSLQAAGGAPPASTKVAGIINDYVESGGAWHVNGEWSLDMKGDSDKADFIASLIMVRSDLWVLSTGVDPGDPALRTPHTHHVALLDGTVTPLVNGWRIAGDAIVTGNGNVAGFSPAPIVVEITGGNALPSSNLRLTFTGAASGHFGTQPLEGVVAIGR
jgi:hypothetical protein